MDSNMDLSIRRKTKIVVQILTPTPSLLKFKTIRTASRMGMGRRRGMRTKETRLTRFALIAGGGTPESV